METVLAVLFCPDVRHLLPGGGGRPDVVVGMEVDFLVA
jgi:hypothetical protein